MGWVGLRCAVSLRAPQHKHISLGVLCWVVGPTQTRYFNVFVLVLQWDHWVGGALGGHASDASMLLQHPPSPLSFFGSPMLAFLLLSLAGWVFFFLLAVPVGGASTGKLQRIKSPSMFGTCSANYSAAMGLQRMFSLPMLLPPRMGSTVHGWAHRPHDPEAYFGKLMGGATRGKAAPERNRGKAARRGGLRLETPASRRLESPRRRSCVALLLTMAHCRGVWAPSTLAPLPQGWWDCPAHTRAKLHHPLPSC